MKIIVTLSIVTFALVTMPGCRSEEAAEAETLAAEESQAVTLPPIEVSDTDFVAAPSAGPNPMPPQPKDEEVPPLPESAKPPVSEAAEPRRAARLAASGPAAEGKRLFDAHGCATCHGVNGDGTRMGLRSFSERAVQEKSDAELIRIMIEGGGPQSAGPHKSRNLGAEQAHAIVTWIRALG